MEQFKKHMKTAAASALVSLLLITAGCRRQEQAGVPDKTLISTPFPTAAVLYPEAGERDRLPGTEPLVHSIPSTVDDIISAVPEADEAVEEKPEILGGYKTYYGDSSKARTVNIENAAKKIDGTVLKPGGVFSCYDSISPFTEKNGYKPAGTYRSGKIVASIGGGVCQISSTLYNAVLKAELEIIERNAHSMTVSYVDLSMDAAIAGGCKDFKFKNSLNNPVIIHATAEDGWIIFEIEGKETRNPDREIKFETVVLSKTEPPEDVVTVDEEKEADYSKITQKAHTGYQTALYKIVYKKGKEYGRELINESSYAPSPNYVTVGGLDKIEEK